MNRSGEAHLQYEGFQICKYWSTFKRNYWAGWKINKKKLTIWMSSGEFLLVTNGSNFPSISPIVTKAMVVVTKDWSIRQIKICKRLYRGVHLNILIHTQHYVSYILDTKQSNTTLWTIWLTSSIKSGRCLSQFTIENLTNIRSNKYLDTKHRK